MSTGLGHRYLPRPEFSPNNPYWPDPRKLPHPELAPKLSARDFLYATTWEMWHPDPHMAYCVRIATIETVRLNTFFGIRNQILALKSKEKAHEA